MIGAQRPQRDQLAVASPPATTASDGDRDHDEVERQPVVVDQAGEERDRRVRGDDRREHPRDPPSPPDRDEAAQHDEHRDDGRDGTDGAVAESDPVGEIGQ